MATTLLDLRRQIRASLASTTDWPDAILDRWIIDAIRFYSSTFPRHWRHTLTLTTGTQAYALPGTQSMPTILSVEYPTSESPLSMLREVEEWSNEFDDADDVYAIRGIGDSTAIDLDTAVHTIVFAETVTTGQFAVIEYLGAHPTPDIGDNDAQITVPRQHWQAILAYCEYRAVCELLHDEAVTVDTSNVSIVLGQLTDSTRAAWSRFKDVMDKLVYDNSGRSRIVTWDNSRIY